MVADWSKRLRTNQGENLQIIQALVACRFAAGNRRFDSLFGEPLNLFCEKILNLFLVSSSESSGEVYCRLSNSLF